jgi:hypothetical protein
MADNNLSIPKFSFEFGHYKNKPGMVYIDFQQDGFNLENPKHKAAIEEVLPVIANAVHKALTDRNVKMYPISDEG